MRVAVWLMAGIMLSLDVASASPGKPTLVTTVEVITRPIRVEIPLTGTTESLQASELSPGVAGLVESVLVEEGDWVKRGQQILTLDASLAMHEVSSAQAGLEEAQARHRNAQRQMREYQSLIESRAVSSSTLASAVSEEDAASASIAKQKAALAHSRELLARHVLTAPFSGVVVNRTVDQGQWVKAEAGVIELVGLNPIRVRASLPQHYFGKIDLSSTASIQFDSLAGQRFSGEPTALVSVGNPGTRNFPLLFTLPNEEHLIAVGMSARVYVQLKTGEKQAMMIPRDAIVLKADGSRIVWKVTRVNEDTKVSPVTVVAGRSVGDLVEVVDTDLRTGDQIVVLGNENLRPGHLVKISKAD